MTTTKTTGIAGFATALAGLLIAFSPAAPADTIALADGHAIATGQNYGTDPLIPYGTEPTSPVRLGYIDSNHDEANTSGGGVDTPF